MLSLGAIAHRADRVDDEGSFPRDMDDHRVSGLTAPHRAYFDSP